MSTTNIVNPPPNILTNFTTIFNGSLYDLGYIFASYNNSIPPVLTNYLANGVDLGYLFMAYTTFLTTPPFITSYNITVGSTTYDLSQIFVIYPLTYPVGTTLKPVINIYTTVNTYQILFNQASSTYTFYFFININNVTGYIIGGGGGGYTTGNGTSFGGGGGGGGTGYFNFNYSIFTYLRNEIFIGEGGTPSNNGNTSTYYIYDGTNPNPYLQAVGAYGYSANGFTGGAGGNSFNYDGTSYSNGIGGAAAASNIGGVANSGTNGGGGAGANGGNYGTNSIYSGGGGGGVGADGTSLVYINQRSGQGGHQTISGTFNVGQGGDFYGGSGSSTTGNSGFQGGGGGGNNSFSPYTAGTGGNGLARILFNI